MYFLLLLDLLSLGFLLLLLHLLLLGFLFFPPHPFLFWYVLDDETLPTFIKRKNPRKGEIKKQGARTKVQASKQPKRGRPQGAFRHCGDFHVLRLVVDKGLVMEPKLRWRVPECGI